MPIIQVTTQHDWTPAMWDWPMQHHDGVVKVHNDANGFEVGLETQFFKPDEIKVQVVDRNLIINCLHEDRTDQFGTVKREINRSYKLPEDVDASTVKSTLTAKGVLVINAQKKK